MKYFKCERQLNKEKSRAIPPFSSIHIACKEGFLLATFRRRLARPKRGPLPFKYVLLITFLFFSIFTVIGLWIINNSLKPTLMSYAQSQTVQIASLIINKSMLETGVEDIRNVMTVDPKTKLTNIDAAKIYKKQGETTRIILENMEKAEQGEFEELYTIGDMEFDREATKEGKGLVYSIPLGRATNNVLLGNIGPHLPIRFTAIGHMESNIETNFAEVGINFVYVEVAIKVKLSIQIIIPFATEVAKLEQKIPIALGVLEGEVPQFYNNGNQPITPSIQLPVE